jgi:uncharacterized protein (TIGR02001 family)
MHRQRKWYLVLLLSASACRADGFGGDLGIASDEVLRGRSQSDHQASPQADLHYSRGGYYGGLSAVGVRRGADSAAGAGLIAYLGYQQRLGDHWSASLVARHYDYPGYLRRNLYNYEEFAATVAWRDLIVATVMVSPKANLVDSEGNYGNGPAYTYELSGRQPLPLGFSANAGVGYYNLHHELGIGYAYWSAGLGKQWRSWNFDVRYVGTDSTAKRHFELAENRLVFSALWLF